MIKIITWILTIAQMVLSIVFLLMIFCFLVDSFWGRQYIRRDHFKMVICAFLIGISELALAAFGQGIYAMGGLWLVVGAGWWLLFIRRQG